MMKSVSRITGTREDREARWQSLLDDALALCSSLEMRLTQAGAILPNTPRTLVELIWRVQFAQLLEQTRSLEKAIVLTRALREDVADLSS